MKNSKIHLNESIQLKGKEKSIKSSSFHKTEIESITRARKLYWHQIFSKMTLQLNFKNNKPN